MRPEIALAHPLLDGRAGALFADLDATVDNLNDLHAGDGDGWRHWVTPYLEHIEPLKKTLLGGFPPLLGGARLGLGLGLTGTLELARLLLMPASVLADELFGGPHAKAWLYGSVLHTDVPAEEAGSAIAGAYLQILGHATGWPSPRGGAQELTNAMVGYLESLGGVVRTSTSVERIVIGGRRVAGVVTAGGERIQAPVVIADTSPHALLGLAGKAMPQSYAERLERFRYGPRTVKIDWSLDGPTPFTAPEARRAGTVHVGGKAAAVSMQTADVKAGRISERPFMLFGQQSIADPTRAPAGRHTAWAYTRVPGQVVGVEAVTAHAERMTDQLERFAPGFRDVVRSRYVQGPQDLQAANVNLVGGDVGGGSYALDQTIFRPLPALVPYATPIKGLWLGSASTFPGGAVHAVPGWTAAGYAIAAARVRR